MDSTTTKYHIKKSLGSLSNKVDNLKMMGNRGMENNESKKMLALIKAVVNYVKHMKSNQEDKINMIESSISKGNNKINIVINFSKEVVQEIPVVFVCYMRKFKTYGWVGRRRKITTQSDRLNALHLEIWSFREDGEGHKCVWAASVDDHKRTIRKIGVLDSALLLEGHA
ncbi:hypothetical protein SUGI_0312270 [Cryptomeria japonica]|nr:hypothetical protein SUGI_0312270 [Cryptomeria japonica]